MQKVEEARTERHPVLRRDVGTYDTEQRVMGGREEGIQELLRPLRLGGLGEDEDRLAPRTEEQSALGQDAHVYSGPSAPAASSIMAAHQMMPAAMPPRLGPGGTAVSILKVGQGADDFPSTPDMDVEPLSVQERSELGGSVEQQPPQFPSAEISMSSRIGGAVLAEAAAASDSRAGPPGAVTGVAEGPVVVTTFAPVSSVGGLELQQQLSPVVPYDAESSVPRPASMSGAAGARRPTPEQLGLTLIESDGGPRPLPSPIGSPEVGSPPPRYLDRYQHLHQESTAVGLRNKYVAFQATRAQTEERSDHESEYGLQPDEGPRSFELDFYETHYVGEFDSQGALIVREKHSLARVRDLSECRGFVEVLQNDGFPSLFLDLQTYELSDEPPRVSVINDKPDVVIPRDLVPGLSASPAKELFPVPRPTAARRLQHMESRRRRQGRVLERVVERVGSGPPLMAQERAATKNLQKLMHADAKCSEALRDLSRVLVRKGSVLKESAKVRYWTTWSSFNKPIVVRVQRSSL